jgi:hypothetical protein
MPKPTSKGRPSRERERERELPFSLPPLMTKLPMQVSWCGESAGFNVTLLVPLHAFCFLFLHDFCDGCWPLLHALHDRSNRSLCHLMIIDRSDCVDRAVRSCRCFWCRCSVVLLHNCK